MALSVAQQVTRMQESKAKHASTHVGTYVDGKMVHLFAPHKRPRPSKCELCGEHKSMMGYHHWDHSRPSHGIWACYVCHMFIERWEKGGDRIIANYTILKEIINDEMAGLA